MTAHAEHRFRLDRRDKNGVSQREHLQSVARQTGKLPPELDGPRFPNGSEHVWEMFCVLHEGRTYGLNGPNPLSYLDMKAWCDLYGITPTLWEIEAVKALDRAWLDAQAEGEGDG